MNKNLSEAANLYRQIEQTHEAMNRALYGYASVSNYNAIDAPLREVGRDAMRTPCISDHIETQETQPLPLLNAFQTYLEWYRLTWVQVAHAARVPSLTVWSIAHGLLVLPQHARRVRSAVERLTGVPFTGPIDTLP